MDKVIRFAGKGFLRAQAEESWREAMARAGGKGAKSASARLKLFADSGYIRFQIRIRQKFGYPDPDLVIEFGCFPFAIHIQFEYEFGYPYLRF